MKFKLKRILETEAIEVELAEITVMIMVIAVIIKIIKIQLSFYLYLLLIFFDMINFYMYLQYNKFVQEISILFIIILLNFLSFFFS